MPSFQQLKKPAVVLCFLGVYLLQTCPHVHFTQKYEDEESSHSSPEAYRLESSPAVFFGEVLWKTSKPLIPATQKTPAAISRVLTPSPSSSSTLRSLFKISSNSSPTRKSRTTKSPKSFSEYVASWAAVSPSLFLLNFYSGNFSYPNSELCPNKPNVTLFILVTSGIDHFEKRRNIRQSWGHYGLRSDVQIAFVIGDSLLHTYDAKVQKELAEEMGIYNDFIVGRFNDTYRTLALKTLHMLDWMSTNCPRAPYFLKTDDDVFLNVPQLLSLIHKIKKEDSENPKIYGHIIRSRWHHPNRNSTHRQFVPYSVYPRDLIYPSFASGLAYLMSTKLARPLFLAVLQIPFIPLEDVLTTGFGAMKLGIPLVGLSGFKNAAKNPSTMKSCELINILAGLTDGSTEQMSRVWFNFVMGRTLCARKSPAY